MTAQGSERDEDGTVSHRKARADIIAHSLSRDRYTIAFQPHGLIDDISFHPPSEPSKNTQKYLYEHYYATYAPNPQPRV